MDFRKRDSLQGLHYFQYFYTIFWLKTEINNRFTYEKLFLSIFLYITIFISNFSISLAKTGADIRRNVCHYIQKYVITITSQNV